MTRLRPTFLLLRLCLLALLLGPAASSRAGVFDDHQGDWLGPVRLQDGRALRVGVSLFRRADGSEGGAYAQPDQGSHGAPLSDVREAGAAIEAQGPNGLRLRLRPVGDELEAELSLGPQRFTARLRRVDGLGAPVRPQTPVPGAARGYTERELVVTAADGVKLAATLSLPTGPGPRPGVVLVGGSGPVDRDASHDGHRPFAVLADDLARHGIAVLRYDKRGVMRSAGRYADNSQDSMVADALAAARALAAQEGVAGVGLVGHSEGGVIAALAAARAPATVTHLVALAAPGLRGRDNLLLQDRLGLRARGVPDAEAEVVLAHAAAFYDTVLAHEDPERRLQALQALRGALSPAQAALVDRHAAGWVTLNPDWARLPQARDLLVSNFGAVWQAVRCPVLALNGDKDVQVPADENLEAIAAALRAGGHRSVRTIRLAGLNHMLQTAGTGLEDEYARIEETVAPSALAAVRAFVASVGREAGPVAARP